MAVLNKGGGGGWVGGWVKGVVGLVLLVLVAWGVLEIVWVLKEEAGGVGGWVSGKVHEYL